MKRIMFGILASTCACKCDEDFGMSQYLKDCTCMKSLTDDVLVTCDKIEYTWESAWIIPVIE